MKDILSQTSSTWGKEKNKNLPKKEELQAELKEKVKEGVKPSDIKKLKRSKSESDLPIPPPPPLPPDHLLHDQLKEKQKEIEELRAKLNGANNSLSSLDKERQTLRSQLETANQALKETKTALDSSLEVRTNSLKDWQKQQEQIRTLNHELTETIDQASTELEKGDSEISSLRTKIWTLKSAKEQLERELKAERIRRNSAPGKTPLPSVPLNSPWITPTLTFCLIGITLYLTIANVR